MQIFISFGLLLGQLSHGLVEVPVGFNSDGLVPSGQGLTLLLGDRYKVEIGDNFNPSTLSRLVDTLGRL